MKKPKEEVGIGLGLKMQRQDDVRLPIESGRSVAIRLFEVSFPRCPLGTGAGASRLPKLQRRQPERQAAQTCSLDMDMDSDRWQAIWL